LLLTALSRDTSKSVYIGVISGILGAIVILTVGVCWNIQRKRIASKRRQLEEARYPRDPASYAHFPVRPGDEEDEAHERGQILEGGEREEERGGRTRDVSEPGSAPIRSYPAMMSVVPNQQALTQPLHTLQLPRLPHALHGSLRSTVPPHLLHPSDLAPLHPNIERERADIPQYEEAAALPPPFFDSAVMIHPPGLGEDGQISMRPSMSSRPVTASAPPAYTPSDTGHMTSSSHEPELEREDEHEHRHEHGHDRNPVPGLSGIHHSGPISNAPVDPLGCSTSPQASS
jgi:hypothetical protein